MHGLYEVLRCSATGGEFSLVRIRHLGDISRMGSKFRCRWEQLSYRGVHMVEAFLIRKRDDVQIGKSEPFYVVVK